MEKNQDQQGKDQNQSMQNQDKNMNPAGQPQQTSGQQQQDENPQDGTQWNNYQTREMGSNSNDSNRGNTESNV